MAISDFFRDRRLGQPTTRVDKPKPRAVSPAPARGETRETRSKNQQLDDALRANRSRR